MSYSIALSDACRLRRRRALTEGGLDKVAHLSGGLFAWYQAGLPFSGEYDTSDVGRTPAAAAAAKYPDAKP
jgi:3-mercaptopyruvate sulfurtransferase SseA